MRGALLLAALAISIAAADAALLSSNAAFLRDGRHVVAKASAPAKEWVIKLPGLSWHSRPAPCSVAGMALALRLLKDAVGACTGESDQKAHTRWSAMVRPQGALPRAGEAPSRRSTGLRDGWYHPDSKMNLR